MDESISMHDIGSRSRFSMAECSEVETSDDLDLELDSVQTGDTATCPPPKEENPMIGKEVSSTLRWNLFVVVLVCVNTAIAVTMTCLFLKSEANKAFELSVSAPSILLQLNSQICF